MSNITAIILSFLQLALRLLDTVDKAAADDFRRSVALDASGGARQQIGRKEHRYRLRPYWRASEK